MGNNKSIFKREAYTVLSLLGDFGGFTDALVLIIGLFTSFYSSRMFQRHCFGIATFTFRSLKYLAIRRIDDKT